MTDVPGPRQLPPSLVGAAGRRIEGGEGRRPDVSLTPWPPPPVLPPGARLPASAPGRADQGGRAPPARTEPVPRPSDGGERAGPAALSPGAAVELSIQLDRIEARLDRVHADAVAAREQVGALVRHLTAPAHGPELPEGIAELLTRADSLDGRLEELAGTVTRLNRVQFKANALLEGKAGQVEAALEALRVIATGQEHQAVARREEEASRPAELRAEGRAGLAADLLPVVDGLERAMESGATLLARPRSQAGADGVGPQGLLGALSSAFTGPSRQAVAEAGEEPALEEALAAWLDGLALGRDRLLELLAGEGIRPLDPSGRPFDPRLHVALATEAHDDRPAGTVVRVLRPGYVRGDRPIRYAEVIVSRTARGTARSAGVDGPGGVSYPGS